jgi:hypothetical protein
MGLWGIFSLHTLCLLVFPIFHYLPDSGFWNFISFFLVILAFALNTFVTFLIALFVFFQRKEQGIQENEFLLVPWALLGFIFAPLIAQQLSEFAKYKYAKVETVEVGKTHIKSPHTLYYFQNTHIAHEFALGKEFKHISKSTKSNNTTSYKVRYKICPIIPKKSTQDTHIELFLIFNEGAWWVEDFDLKYPAQIANDLKYVDNYVKLVQEWKKTNNMKVANNPVFLGMINHQRVINDTWWYARLYYILVIGGWLCATLIALLQKIKVRR